MSTSNDENRHIPVLLDETIDAFTSLSSSGGTIVDCTLGGGGHTHALLERFSNVRVLACDMDANAIDLARVRLASYLRDGRVAFHHGNFSTLPELDESQLPQGFAPPWNGILMDLGYSSNQLESEDYGMSFSIDSEIDMRLSRPASGQTAWELMQECSAQELGDILKAYGEIIGAHRLARRIRDALDAGSIHNSTAKFAHFIESASGGRRSKDSIHPATLVFQALRIAVNDELRVLDHFLEGVILKTSKSGRIAIITFHSLEDRIVKYWGKKYAATVRAVTRKPIVASQEEIKANPRSRSAKLRIYERI